MQKRRPPPGPTPQPPHVVPSSLALYVTQTNGAPLSDAVLLVDPLGQSVTPRDTENKEPAIIDIIDKQFQPRVLAIHTDTRVIFKNHDNIEHYVYSFSSARPFSLPIPSGESRGPLVFDRPGPVVLGCKIYGAMIGYIYVTDAAYFGTTDSYGFLRLDDLQPGTYSVKLWYSRQSESNDVSYKQTIVLRVGTETLLRVHLPSLP